MSKILKLSVINFSHNEVDTKWILLIRGNDMSRAGGNHTIQCSACRDDSTKRNCLVSIRTTTNM